MLKAEEEFILEIPLLMPKLHVLQIVACDNSYHLPANFKNIWRAIRLLNTAGCLFPERAKLTFFSHDKLSCKNDLILPFMVPTW